MKTPKRNLMRIYGPPAAVVAMGALWMWGDLGASMRGAIFFCAAVIALSLFVGIRSERRTRRRIAESERRLELLRQGGLDALRKDLADDPDKEAA